MAQQELYSEGKQHQFSISKNNKALEQTTKLSNFKTSFLSQMTHLFHVSEL